MKQSPVQYHGWSDYLQHLEQNSTLVSRKMLNAVKGICHFISPLSMQPPHDGPSDDGLAYEMVWDEGRYHLEIELEDDMYSWLYRDRETDTYTGGEVFTVDELITEINPYLALFQ